MIAAASFLLLIVASLVVTRVATVALSLTGLSRESARFQARSALSGTGFTTQEAEAVVNHPVRRQIARTLMLLGSAGLITGVAALSLSFAGAGTEVGLTRLAYIAAGCALVLLVARSRTADRAMTALFTAVLRRTTDLDIRDYSRLLHLSDGHAVIEIAAMEGSWVCGRPLAELELRSEGVGILGIERAGAGYMGAPTGATTVDAGDTLIVYGRYADACELGRRPAGEAGDKAHAEAVVGHALFMREGTS